MDGLDCMDGCRGGSGADLTNSPERGGQTQILHAWQPGEHRQPNNQNQSKYMAITFKAGKPASSEFHVEAGDYRLRVVEASEDTSRAGNDMIKLKLRVVRDNGSDGPGLFDYLVFSESAFWKVDTFLKSCGKHPGEGEEIALDPDDMIGWECMATLSVETYDGKKSNKVAAYLFDEGF